MGSTGDTDGQMMIATAKSLGMNILDRIGNTPLVRLDRLTAELPGIQIAGQGGVGESGRIGEGPRGVGDCGASDRSAGCWAAGKHLLDATSGNTGIAYAMLGAAMGISGDAVHAVECVAGAEAYLPAYGAKVVWTDPAEGSDGAIRKARELAADDRTGTTTPTSTRTTRTGGRTTGRDTANEIWEQTEGQVTHFVAGTGDERDIYGHDAAAEGAEPEDPVRVDAAGLAVQGLEGSEAYGDGDCAGDLRPEPGGPRTSRWRPKTAYAMAKRLGRVEGLLVGVSAAAATAAAAAASPRKRHAQGREAVIVTILCDGADKYLSERFWEEGE